MKYVRVLAVIGVIVICLLVYKHQSDRDIIKVNEVLVGESDHWIAQYKVKGNVEFYEEDSVIKIKADGYFTLELKYKGELEEISYLRMIEIERKSGKMSETFPEAPTSLNYSHSGNLNAISIIDISKGKPIELHVTWDGQNGDTEEIKVK